MGGAFGEERRVNYGPLRLAVLPEMADLEVEGGLDGAQASAYKTNKISLKLIYKTNRISLKLINYKR